MPPFALFLVALCLTDGARDIYDLTTDRAHTPPPLFFLLAVMTMTFFFNVTDTGKKERTFMGRGRDSRDYPRFVATDWPVDIALLHHFVAPRVFCWYRLYRGGLDARLVVETPSSREETKRMRRAGTRTTRGRTNWMLDVISPPPDPFRASDIARRDSRLRNTSPRMPLDASENGFVGYIRYKRRCLLWFRDRTGKH